MTTKLHINLAQGIIDVEGDPDFVLKVYEDFKDKTVPQFGREPEGDVESRPNEKTGTLKPKVKQSARKPKPQSKGDSAKVASYKSYCQIWCLGIFIKRRPDHFA